MTVVHTRTLLRRKARYTKEDLGAFQKLIALCANALGLPECHDEADIQSCRCLDGSVLQLLNDRHYRDNQNEVLVALAGAILTFTASKEKMEETNPLSVWDYLSQEDREEVWSEAIDKAATWLSRQDDYAREEARHLLFELMLDCLPPL